jgi:putative toxin-antitoxin system antitoxin component (TIGR02293 family)
MKAATARKKTVNAIAARGSNGYSTRELVRKIESGLSFRELEKLREQLGLPLEELSDKLGISRATLHRRKIAGRLTSAESDKVMRFAHLFQLAERVLGGADEARQWLSYPQFGLGRVVPLEFARTEIGAREVETLLGRIEYSVYT